MEANVTRTEPKGEVERKTLFVRNLPYTTTDKKLEDTFSEYGPIKRCFVVKDRDKEQMCRGFGYVTFVMQDDVSKALATNIQIDNRKVKLTVAEKKPRQRDNYQSKNKDKSEEVDEITEKEVKQNENVAKVKHNEVKQKDITPKIKNVEEEKRTIILSNLGDKTTKSKLKKLCAKQGKVEKIQYPVEGRTDHSAYVIFKSIKSAVRASQKLNGSKFNDNVISSCLFKKEGKQHPSRQLEKSQLIVRNLSFKCTEDKLNEVFAKFGQIVKVELPIKVNAKGKKKFLGFSFVQYSNPNEAKKALDGLNKTELLGRPMVIDWAVPKDEYEKEKGSDEKSTSKDSEDVKGKEKQETKRKQKKKRDKEDDNSDDVGESEEDDDSENDDDDEAEMKKAKKVKKRSGKADDDDSDEGDGSDEDDGASDEDDEEFSDDEFSGEEFSDEEFSDDEDNEDFQKKEEERKARLKEQAKDAKEGKTIFMRNLPFEISEDEIIEHFEKFGDIDYCKIVYDPETGHSRGTAFLKYKDIDAADMAVAQSEEAADDEGIIIGERKIIVMKAVTRGKVMEIEKQRKIEKKDPKDKRNLYLANEGVIFPNSEAAKELSESDLKMRDKAWTEKKAKLKNQNYFISKTRLCFRNLPLTTGEKELKDSIKVHCPKGTKIVRALVMRNRERLDKTGKGRSLGFAFVEFKTHEQALAVLRATNNNPDVFGSNRRPIVEFSVENQLALNLQKKRLERQKQKAEKVDKEASDVKGTRGLKRKIARKDNRKEKGGEKWGIDKGFSGSVEVGETTEKKQRSLVDSGSSGQAKNSTRNRKKVNKKQNLEIETKAKLGDNSIKSEHGTRMKINQGKDGFKDRKRTYDEKSDPPIKAKKPKKKVVKDPEEDNFNLLVNKYKEKLFGDQIKNKKNGKRWFE